MSLVPLRKILFVFGSLTLSACPFNLEVPERVLNAIPERGLVLLDVPGEDASDGQALVVGERSPFYETTYDISTGVNGGIHFVFEVIEEIVAHPPTLAEESHYEWGPSEPKGLEKNAWWFIAEEIEEGKFSFTLKGKPKGESDEAFVDIFSGEAIPSDDDKGTGTITLFFDNMRILNDDECHVGQAAFTYDANSEPRQVDVVFSDFANTCKDEDKAAATYHYEEAEDGSGAFEFTANGNIHGDEESKPLEEHFAIRSRWLGSGSGRSDVVISQGEVPGDLVNAGLGAVEVQLTECWDDLFALVYADTTPEELRPHIREMVGNIEDCVFETSDFAQEVQ